MDLREAFELNEGKGWDAIEKKINMIRKKVDKVDTDISQLRKDCIKAGSNPEDWSTVSSYATDDFNGTLDNAQELVDKFK